jgi:hypothetical protein
MAGSFSSAWARRRGMRAPMMSGQIRRANAVEEQAEKHLGGEPRADRVVAIIRKTVEVTE